MEQKMAIKAQSKKQKGKKSFYKLIVVAIALAAMIFVLNVAPNYIQDARKNQTNLVFNNNNVTAKLKNKVMIKDKTVYLSAQDIKTYF